MPRVRTTKFLAKRIDLQYFTRRDGFRRLLLWLSAGLPLVALVWIAWAYIARSQSIYTKGPLSSAHAVLSSNCRLCHVQAASFRANVPDRACLGCHDAPAHEARQTFTPSCSVCHVEHIGRARLAEVSDAGCVECHRDLKTTDGQHLVDPHVSGFDRGHPEFYPLRTGYLDPSTINLNHFVHLQPTIRGPNGAVQMVCDDCHRPTNSQGPWPYSVATVQPASQQPLIVGPADVQQRKRRNVEAGAGAYMTPIRYVNQCAACHLLQFDRIIAEPAPHDRPEVVHNFIIQKYTQYIALHPEVLRRPALEIDDGMARGPSDASLRPAGNQALALASSPADWVQQRAGEAERLLWNKNCKLCHESTEHEGSGLPQTVKAVIPARWLPRSEFDHEAHRMLACVSCHSTIPASRKTSDINLPGIAACRQCHKEAGASRQAAEGRCFECHSYHDWRKERPTNGIMEIAQPRSSMVNTPDRTNSTPQQ
jgi:Cytochrome c7 and related cytochrome c